MGQVKTETGTRRASPEKTKIPPPIHGGNVYKAAREQGRPVSQFVDFSASINPLGLSPAAHGALVKAIPASIHYPDPFGDDLRKRIGDSLGVDRESIVLGNGSVELISVLARALSLWHGLIIGPTFMEFERALALRGAQCTYVHANAADNYDPPLERVRHILLRTKNAQMKGKKGRSQLGLPIDSVFLCNPNSPTGRAVSRSAIHQLLRTVEQVNAHLIVDEAFIDFCSSCSVLRDVAKSQFLLVLRSFTKFFAMPGLRIGYMVGPPKAVDCIRASLPPWSVNSLAQEAALAALQDGDYRRRSLGFLRHERGRFFRLLKTLPGVRVYPSRANFVLLTLPAECLASRVAEWCRAQGVLVRECQDFSGMDDTTLRLAIRRPKENDLVVKLLRRALVLCR